MLVETSEKYDDETFITASYKINTKWYQTEFSQYLTHNLEQLILPTSFPKPLPNSQKNSSTEDVDSFSLNISLEKTTTEENNNNYIN